MKTDSKTFFFKRAFVLLLALLTLTACHDKMVDYKQTVRSGIATLPWPKEMEALFGEGDHAITHYAFSPGPKDWWTEIHFGGRYTLTMHVDVEIDYEKNLIVKYVSPPRFSLVEVGSLVRENGEIRGAKIADQWFFDEMRWKKLVEAKGDWSVIGLPVKNSLIPSFDEYVKICRAPK